MAVKSPTKIIEASSTFLIAFSLTGNLSTSGERKNLTAALLPFVVADMTQWNKVAYADSVESAIFAVISHVSEITEIHAGAKDVRIEYSDAQSDVVAQKTLKAETMKVTRNKIGFFVGLIVAFSATCFLLQSNESQNSRATGANTATSSGDQRYMRPNDEVLRSKLTPLQYRVTQQEGTESPFSNSFWDNKEEGIYVDIVSGEPLFSSKEKFKSGTGWPSFYQPLISENIVEKSDFSLLGTRTEVRSRYGDSHLGHVFNDGPAPTGLRYCINSAALRFIPAEELAEAGYDEFESLFSSKPAKTTE